MFFDASSAPMTSSVATYSSVASLIFIRVTSRWDLSRMYCTTESMVASILARK